VHTPPEHDSVDTLVDEQPRPQSPQLVVEALTDVSQPPKSGAVVTQFLNPATQPVYVHVVPVEHAAPTLVVVSHLFPHPPQSVAVVVEVSQPSTFGLEVEQSAKPPEQPVYEHFVPSHEAPELCVVSHLLPHPPQLSVVVVGVSHPSVSGAVVLQSA